MSNRHPHLNDLLRTKDYYMSDGHFRLASGLHSDAYVQARLAFMDPDVCRAFRDAVIEHSHALKPTAVGAFTIGGILLGASVAEQLDLPLVVGRKAGKTYEWLQTDRLTPDTRLLLIDDVLTTGSQIEAALAPLENTTLGEVSGIVVGVYRSVTPVTIRFRGAAVEPVGATSIPLLALTTSACQLCRAGIPYVDFSNPEQNFSSVILSQPPDKAPFILKGYKAVYALQQDRAQLDLVESWQPWLPVLVAGLPIARVTEDSRLVQFVRLLSDTASGYSLARSVLSEVVGQLLSISQIRVESRSVGCSLLIGDPQRIERILEAKSHVRPSTALTCADLPQLVPYFDALDEATFAFIFDKAGNFVGIRRLLQSTKPLKDGIELLRHVTRQTQSLGFVVRRGRSALSVYAKGSLEAVGELAQRTGLWEFSRPMERVENFSRQLPGVRDTLPVIVEAARELVRRGFGGLFVVGDMSPLSYAEPKVHIDTLPLDDVPLTELVELAKLDGAVFISTEGMLTKASVIIKNKGKEGGAHEPRQGTSGHFGGSRKQTALQTSLECPDAAALYVSQNGTIEVYHRGESWPVADAISGLRR